MNSFYQVFIESPNPTYIKNLQGKIIWANNAYADLHRCSLQNIIETGEVDFDFSDQRDLEALSSDDLYKIKEYYKFENGGGAWFLTVKKAIVDQNGERYLLSTSTEVKTSKDETLSAESHLEIKELLLKDLDDELSKPLEEVKNIIKLLKDEIVSKEQNKHLNKLLSITNDLNNIGLDILERNKVDEGKIAVESAELDIAKFLKDVFFQLNFEISEQEAFIEFNEPTVIFPPLDVNTRYLNIIIRKIINSILKYTNSSEIKFSVVQKERLEKLLYLQFTFICLDSHADFLKLKERFEYDANSTERDKVEKRKEDLGLYLSKKLIQLQGGKIWFEQGDNRDGCIKFILPFSISKDFAKDKSRSSNFPEQLKNLTILLVEDNESSQILVKHQLQYWNIKIDIASKGEEGVEFAKRSSYDLILMDIEMPGIDGFQATSQIRTLTGPNQQTPIIAFTANARNIDLDGYKKSGFSDYLLKPYHVFDLYLCISKNTGQYSSDTGLPVNLQKAPYKLFDFSGLGNLSQDAVFIKKMQQLFIDLVPTQLKKLRQAVDEKEWESVALIAHSLKSTYGNIKVMGAADTMKQIENIARNKTYLENLEGLIKDAEAITLKVIDVFNEELSGF